MTQTDDPVSSGLNGTPRPWYRRLFAAQESGLVLVILVLGLLLTVFGGSKIKSVRFDLDVNDQITTRQIADSDGGETHYEVTIEHADGSSTRHISIRQPRERTTDSGRFVLLSVKANRFLDLENLVLVTKDASFIAIMAVGMTGVIILAGIDLSVGSIYGLVAIIGAMILHELPGDTSAFVSVPIGVIVCMAAGAMCGLANGVMVVGLKVHPFVITLGMMAALRGLTVVLPKELYDTQSIGQFPASYTSGFFKAEIFGVYPVPVVIMVIVGLIGMFLLSRTVFGRQVFAVGGNETAAGYAGISVGRVKILVYTLAGLTAGMSAAIYLGYLGAAETSAGNAYELRVIAATVIGGASLMGGRGTALGAVLGAILIEMINNAMIILDIDQDYNQIVMGAAIIVAVVIDQTKGKMGSRRRS